jgi:hypothetical protein
MEGYILSINEIHKGGFMAKNALTINENYNLMPSFIADSWSKFTRDYSSATSFFSKVPVGTFVEVTDKKLLGDSLIIFRRTDFDKLNQLSSMASKITRCLMQIDRMTTTYSNEKADQVIKLIHEEARMGIEFTIVQSKSSASDYFSTYAFESNENFVMPTSRKGIEGK